MATETTRKDGIILWQVPPDELGEPALLITPWCGSITISQEGRYINVSNDCINELCRALKAIRKV